MKEFDLYSVSTLVMICSRKGYILYDRNKDRQQKAPRRGSNPTRQRSNTRVHYSTGDEKSEEQRNREARGMAERFYPESAAEAGHPDTRGIRQADGADSKHAAGQTAGAKHDVIG